MAYEYSHLSCQGLEVAFTDAAGVAIDWISVEVIGNSLTFTSDP